jgi:hypothetical protein
MRDRFLPIEIALRMIIICWLLQDFCLEQTLPNIKFLSGDLSVGVTVTRRSPRLDLDIRTRVNDFLVQGAGRRLQDFYRQTRTFSGSKLRYPSPDFYMWPPSYFVEQRDRVPQSLA